MTTMSKRTLLKSEDNRWCKLEVELSNEGRLSICGSAGRVVPVRQAKAEALEYWRSYFDENKSAIQELNDRCGKRFTSARGAAKYVLECDGDYHGLDLEMVTRGGAYLTESCGQIVEDLRKWFPEVAHWLSWHLNDMHAECEHQEARGEKWTTHSSAVCPDCGYKLGSAWLKREIPATVLSEVKVFLGTGDLPDPDAVRS